MAIRVLIVDDDENSRALMEATLCLSGYEVSTVADGQSGLRTVAATPPDVVLLDVRMPGMNGYEVSRRLHLDPLTARIPIIMITACNDPHLNQLAFAAGAGACIGKPFRREALIALIETLHAGAVSAANKTAHRKGATP